MAQRFTYGVGAELPGLTLPWSEETAQNVWTELDLSSGYTFAWNLRQGTIWAFTAATVRADKATGVTGYDGGVTLTFATGDLELATGDWRLYLRAREVATSKDRDYSPKERIVIHITTA